MKFLLKSLLALALVLGVQMAVPQIGPAHAQNASSGSVNIGRRGGIRMRGYRGGRVSSYRGATRTRSAYSGPRRGTRQVYRGARRGTRTTRTAYAGQHYATRHYRHDKRHYKRRHNRRHYRRGSRWYPYYPVYIGLGYYPYYYYNTWYYDECDYYRRWERPAYCDRPVYRTAYRRGALKPWTPEWFEYCRRKFRSFDERTGYYTTYSGKKRFCR